MQENLTAVTQEEQDYKEFKRKRRIEEAKAEVAKIEYDILSPLDGRAALKEYCRQANVMKIGALVVFPSMVKTCVSYLGKDPKVSLVGAISYPFGEDTTPLKADAVKRAVKDGVDEVEVCAPLAYIREGNFSYFRKECKKVKKAAKKRAVRIVIDCAYLEEKDAIKCASVAADAGVNCVRLKGVAPEVLAKIKTALKGKCLIKGERAANFSEYARLIAMGADTVSCAEAFSLAAFILNKAAE